MLRIFQVHLKQIKLLAKAGIDVNATDFQGMTALFHVKMHKDNTTSLDILYKCQYILLYSSPKSQLLVLTYDPSGSKIRLRGSVHASKQLLIFR